MPMPLEQYPSQLYGTLGDKLYYSLVPQVEHDLWYQLCDKFQVELGKESHKFTLEEELKDKCSR